MPDQSTPKEVDPGDVALSPEKDICEDIYQRVLAEVRARIDQRIAAIEAQAAADAVVAGESAVVESADPPARARRRPLLRAAVTLMATAGLVGAVVSLARDHTESITPVTDRIDAAIQSVRESLPKTAWTGAPDNAMGGSNSSDRAEADSPPRSMPSLPDAMPSPDTTTVGRSSDPTSAMAEARPEHDMPPAPDRDIAPLLEKIAHDIAELQTGLQDLKASQEQAGRDHAKAIEQLQAGQDQLARTVRSAKTEATTVGAAPRAAPRPAQPPPRPRFPGF
ncbi:hypothetical protein ACQR1I_13905 [Bradyrhizobium sp. HKCCYLS2038]|uniref:hypothetical protein n=1 Tax=unclassified Bradyrhizobium TaxID=2631580 RepID=UPI003EB86936